MRKLIPMMLASLLYPAGAFPLGLGEIRLYSALNQPFSAEIDLLSVGAEDAATITANLASSEVFAQLGVDRSSALLLVRFEVKRRPDGTYFVEASSRHPIRETYLDFLLELNWRSGRVLREYTVLLDPPELTAPPAAVVQPPVIAGAAPEEVAPAAPVPTPPVTATSDAAAPIPSQSEPTETSEAVSPQIAVVEASPDTEVVTYGPVQRNETLGEIALRVRPDKSITLPQMMIALVRANPHAFYGRNINRLKAGHVLRFDATQLAAITHEEAAREVALQGREWADFKQRAAARAAQRTPSGAGEAQSGAAVATAPQEEPRLKLVAPQEVGSVDKEQAAAPGTGGKDADTLRDELMIANETAEAHKQENDDLRRRTQELEAQLASMQRLLSLKDNDLAALQRQTAQAGQSPSASQAPAAELPEAPVVEEPAPLKAPAAAADVTAPSQGTTPMAVQPAPAMPKPIKPAPAVAPVALPVEEPGFFAGNELMVGLAGFVVAVLAALGFVQVRRRRSGASFQESILMGSSPSMLSAKAAEKKPAEETSFFSDFAVSGMGDIHAEDSEVDPLTEADVYMAYQRFQQAEELLREAMKRNDRPELHVKLLEVFHATRDKAAFEAEAMRVNDMLQGEGPLWEKVLVLGHELLPQHALFAQAPEKASLGGSHTDARRDNDVLDIGLDLDALTEEMESGGQTAGEFNLDLGIDFSDLEEAKPQAQKAPEPAASTKTESASTPAAASTEDEGLELDLGDLDLHLADEAQPETAAVTAADETVAESLDFGGLDMSLLDMPAGSGEERREDPTSGSRAANGPATVADLSGVDLGDFDLESLALELSASANGTSSGTIDAATDLESLVFEAAAPGGEAEDPPLDEMDETGTKLDLARAYVEMGDNEGARSILDEVIQEGNPLQKQQAQEILRQIA